MWFVFIRRQNDSDCATGIKEMTLDPSKPLKQAVLETGGMISLRQQLSLTDLKKK